VEELMLLANEVVARFLMSQMRPAIFRVHAPPDETKLERVVTLCDALGIEFDPDDASDPQRLGLFLDGIADHPLAQIIGQFTLRSLKQAAYDVSNIGHYGLALDAYLHFTSPIRRYPDLIIHRIVKRLLLDEGRAKEQADDQLALVAQLCSQRERKVMEIEREVSDLYRTVLMRKHIGEEFVGRVVEVASASLIVAIDSPYIDVRVPFSLLGNEDYEASDDGLCAVAARSGDSVGLGEEIKIRIEEANINRRSTIARRLVESKKNKTHPKKSERERKDARGKHKSGKPSKKRGDSRKR
jgi:ribonuclease R